MRATAIARVGTVFDATYLGNSLREWLTAAAIFAVSLAVLVLVRRVLVRRLATTAPQTATDADDLLLGALRRTRFAFLTVFAIAIARAGLDLAARYDHRVDVLARLALYAQMVSWGNGAVAYWLVRARANRIEHDKAALTSLNLLGVVARVTLWVVLILLALDALGINVTALITGLGVAGVAVALAVQSTLGDLLASLAIALDKPFVVGDFIVIDQYMGTVENVGLKTTRIRSLSGEQIVIANAELLKARIRNYQRQAERRVVFQVAIDPDMGPDVVATVPPIIRQIVAEIPQTRLDRSHFSAITDAAYVVETVYFVTTADYNVYMDIQQRINLALLKRLEADRVRLAFAGRETVMLTVGADGRAGGAGTNGVDAAAGASRGAAPATSTVVQPTATEKAGGT